MKKDKAKRARERALPANYGKATPRQVAEAVLKYRPGNANGTRKQASRPQ